MYFPSSNTFSVVICRMNRMSMSLIYAGEEVRPMFLIYAGEEV
jgi:hypothetical protein